MPPHGHGHHGGGHHGGGGHRGGRWYGGGPAWYGPTEVIVADPCGDYDPVLATDGRVYDNPCFARRAGRSVVRRVTGSGIPAVSGIVDQVTSSPALMVGIGIGAYLLFKTMRKK